jgi:hypothetical protein
VKRTIRVCDSCDRVDDEVTLRRLRLPINVKDVNETVELCDDCISTMLKSVGLL